MQGCFCRGGAGLLDVAGGKGELSFELRNLNGIPATVLEPRPLDLRQRAEWLAVRVGGSPAGAMPSLNLPLPPSLPGAHPSELQIYAGQNF
jgi:hypothetical protein